MTIIDNAVVRNVLFLVSLATVCALAGCAGVATPEEHFYRLPVALDDNGGGQSAVSQSAVRQSGTGQGRMDGILEVQRFTADALLGGQRVVFAHSDSPFSLQQYHYHAWADPLPRMLQELTVQVLRRAGVAQEVVTPELRARRSYELRGNIKHLEHVRGEPSRVKVAMEFALSRVSDGELLWVEEIAVDQEVSDDSVETAVRAMGGGLTEILRSLANMIGGSSQ